MGNMEKIVKAAEKYAIEAGLRKIDFLNATINGESYNEKDLLYRFDSYAPDCATNQEVGLIDYLEDCVDKFAKEHGLKTEMMLAVGPGPLKRLVYTVWKH